MCVVHERFLVCVVTVMAYSNHKLGQGQRLLEKLEACYITLFLIKNLEVLQWVFKFDMWKVREASRSNLLTSSSECL